MDRHSRGRSHLAATVEGQHTVVVGGGDAVAAAGGVEVEAI